MAEQGAERTEPATPKKREEARKRGEVAQSRDFAGAMLLAAAFTMLGGSAATALVATLCALCRETWGGLVARPEGVGDFHALLLHAFSLAGRALAPFALALVLASIAAHVVQTGPLFSFEILTPRASRLSLAQGAQRLFGSHAVIELGKALLKVLLVVAIAWRVLSPQLASVLGLSQLGVGEGFLETLALVQRFAFWVLAPLLVLGIGDLALSMWRLERNLRMTREDVREEVRQREGSPHVRSRQRTLARELSRSRMIAAVAKADVVVVNPTHFAVALRYDRPNMRAPKVVARGRNHLALRIRHAAEQARVPIVQDAPLAQLLYKTVRLDREIPETLFQAVAEILAQVYRIDPRRGASWRTAP